VKVVEKMKTNILYPIKFYYENRAIYEIMSKKKMVETVGATNDVRIWRIRVAYWISKTTCTHMHTLPVTRTRARPHAHTQVCNTYCFSTATMIRERASLLLYTYITCIVFLQCSEQQIFPYATLTYRFFPPIRRVFTVPYVKHI
jgi:hypothetical protein